MKRTDQDSAREKGFSLIEVLVGLFLLAVIGLGLAQSAIVAMRFQKRAEIGNIAKNLAVSKAEELSGVQFDLLNDSYDNTETDIIVGNHKIKFDRETDVTVNSDGSRTIEIKVSGPSVYLPKVISYTTRFAPWES